MSNANNSSDARDRASVSGRDRRLRSFVEQIRTDSRDRLATVAQHYDEETYWSQRQKNAQGKDSSV